MQSPGGSRQYSGFFSDTLKRFLYLQGLYSDHLFTWYWGLSCYWINWIREKL